MRRQEIGSYFESPSGISKSPARRWLPKGAQLVIGGRQALGLIADHCARGGVDEVLVPDHHCESMVQPFRRRGMRVIPVVTDRRVLMEPEALIKAHILHPLAMVLHCETFGNLASPELADAISSLRNDGCLVVVDETHSLFARHHTEGDFRIASLRKLLPIDEGAYVTGVPLVKRGHSKEALEFRRLRRAAASMKREYLNGDRPSSEHNSLFGDAEVMLDSVPDNAACDPRLSEHLVRLRLDDFFVRRLSNAAALASRLDEHSFDIVNPDGWRSSPCFIVIELQEAQLVRAALAKRGIYCPIHWPPPTGFRPISKWRRNLLSFVVDQRYDAKDMQFIADSLVDVLGKGEA